LCVCVCACGCVGGGGLERVRGGSRCAGPRRAALCSSSAAGGRGGEKETEGPPSDLRRPARHQNKPVQFQQQRAACARSRQGGPGQAHKNKHKKIGSAGAMQSRSLPPLPTFSRRRRRRPCAQNAPVPAGGTCRASPGCPWRWPALRTDCTAARRCRCRGRRPTAACPRRSPHLRLPSPPRPPAPRCPPGRARRQMPTSTPRQPGVAGNARRQTGPFFFFLERHAPCSVAPPPDARLCLLPLPAAR
jgi:hypothetical protein